MIAGVLAWASARAWWIGAIAAGLALAWLHGCSVGEERVRAKYEAQAAKSARQSAAAAERASVASEARAALSGRENEELRHEANKGTADPVGAGTRAVLERLREQQSGAPSPAP